MTDTTAEQTDTPDTATGFARFLAALGLLRESWVGMIGLFLVSFWVLIAVFVDLLPLQDPLAQTRGVINFPMLTEDKNGVMHWMGTDDRGRDLLARLLHGSRVVLFWSTLATIVAYSVGMIMGVTAGYRGGWWDEIISFIGNVLLSFPQIVLLLVILTAFGPNSNIGVWMNTTLGMDKTIVSGALIIVAITFSTAPQVARIVRGIVLDLKTRDYIAAAEVRGEGPLWIMLVELLPNARGPLIVDACLRLGYVIITIALLGFLSLGLPPPDPDWGKMISDGRQWGYNGLNMMLWPALAISSLVLGLNLLADGLREISLRD
ncbi:MAG: ABC transporter permease [Anderseniella sp.]|jgi:peptide/nickel transport system permease protein|nr:ABC transporter permease [Anderseniella sp.]